ncbi:hypothetical protein [Pleionea sediminis]|uniref:hypothetical protein n=1 Tax=Pleionea sediminis TaxID=2569479 RepID=UPI00118610FA|nr:hypothetical protein [Pleionea sediminis]
MKNSKRCSVIFWLSILFSSIFSVWIYKTGFAQSLAINSENILLALVFGFWPVLFYFTLHKEKKNWLYLTFPFAVGIIIGSYTLEEHEKVYWIYLEWARYALIPVAILFEGFVLYLIFKTYRSLSKGDVNEEKLKAGVRKHIGEGVGANLLIFELLMWYYSILSWRKKTVFEGDNFFTYHSKDGNASSQLAFVIVTAIGIPIVHLFFHFIWSPVAAWVITALSIYSVFWLLGEYRATLIRPISINQKNLFIRFGLIGDETVPLDTIESIVSVSGSVPRQKGVIRYKGATAPNIKITLKPETKISGLFGERETDKIYLAVDSPQNLIKAVNLAIESTVSQTHLDDAPVCA